MTNEAPLSIQRQGAFAAGGVTTSTPGTFDPIHGQAAPEGQLRHSDHASVIFQIPAAHNGHSVVFLHGYGQSRTGWMSTPDGREGFSDLFLRRGFGVYLVDQPRRGDAGQSSVPTTLPATPDDLTWFTQFRLGLWPQFQEGTQMPTDDASMDQFFRQMTPDTGEFDPQVIASALVEVFEKSGTGVLMSHSQGGVPAWLIQMGSENVAAHVAIEPGTFPFPEGEVPEPINTAYPVASAGMPVPLEVFEAAICSKPVAVYFGDYIPTQPSEVPAWDFWRGQVELAHRFAEVVNAHGGDATVFLLPDEGIRGNSHFMFQERNNVQIADHIGAWLSSRNIA